MHIFFCNRNTDLRFFALLCLLSVVMIDLDLLVKLFDYIFTKTLREKIEASLEHVSWQWWSRSPDTVVSSPLTLL